MKMMNQLNAGVIRLHARLSQPAPLHDEKGSVSVEQAMITGAVALVAALVIAAIKAFVETTLATLG